MQSDNVAVEIWGCQQAAKLIHVTAVHVGPPPEGNRFGIDPARHAESAGILAEVRRVVEEELTAHQRRVFTAIVVDGIPLDALAARLGSQRNAAVEAPNRVIKP